MAKKNDWKRREGVVYSTAPDFNYAVPGEGSADSIPPNQQLLQIFLDTSGRAGKQVTVISGFAGKQEDLEILAKMLKTKCGVGGSVKEGEILIQGDLRQKVVQILQNGGYRTRQR